MSSHINEELLIEILKRLPPKTLLKFKSVSKSFHSLITNPSFISTHTNHTIKNSTKSTNKPLILRHYSWIHKQEQYTIIHPRRRRSSSVHNNHLYHHRNLVFPFKSYSQYFEIIGSINGILCLSDTYKVNSHTIILWNPSIRKTIVLPPSGLHFDQISMFVLGFGFDSTTGDFKVVRVVYRDHTPINRVQIPQIEVYQLGLNSWRRIRIEAASRYIISELSLQVFLNGAVHWIGYNPSAIRDGFRDGGGFSDGFSDLNIVFFDLSRELFDEMRLPESVRGLSVLDLCVFRSENLLSLMEYRRNSPSLWVQYGGFSIWVMKEYGKFDSWSKQFTIDLQGGVGKGLGVLNNGDEMVIVVKSNGDLVLYDVQSGEITHLGIKGIVNSFHVEDYVETLVLLDCSNSGSY